MKLILEEKRFTYLYKVQQVKRLIESKLNENNLIQETINDNIDEVTLNESMIPIDVIYEKYKKKHLGELYIEGKAVYQGREVTLNKPTRGDVKKFKVYVNSGKKTEDGRIKAIKVNFGHGGTSAKERGEKTMRIKKSNPERRKAFRARHGCDKGNLDRKTPRYWSCRAW